MMKPSFVIVLLLYTAACFSQKILIPFRSGTQFGLSDVNGKIIVSPQYDIMRWLQGGWFETGKKIMLKDTLETAPGKFFIRNSSATVSGIIHNDNIILKDEPFDEYEIIINKCIVAEYQGRAENLTKEQFKKYGVQRKIISLFSLQGKNLYPENFKRIQKVDTAGISKKDNKTGRYILFVGISLTERYCMFVFDADEQKISEWLVKDAFNIQANRKIVADKKIGFEITDGSYNRSTKILDYTGGKFTLSEISSQPESDHSLDRVESVDIAEVMQKSPGYDVAVESAREGEPIHKKPAFNPYHIMVKDTLFYLRKSYQDKNAVNPGPNGKIILLQQRAMTQYQPVIVKNKHGFYIVKEDQLSVAVYDSLIYFGKYFLAWQNINGQIKAGVIDADGKEIIPVIYDSLYADIKYFELKDMNPAGKPDYRVVLKEADSKYNNIIYPYKRNYSGILTVFKKGRCGIINMKGELIVPVQYDLIARNNLQHSRPRQDEFIIVKENNRYGIANFKYSKGKNTADFILTAPPKFEFIPGFYYSDYYGIKDFKLFGLYDGQFQFKGYADSNGKKYYID